VERLERLINLVIALRETRTPLTAADIRGRVAGYDQEDTSAFRRMFERDKADLRALGVPIDLEVDAWGDAAGYRIDPSRYDLPEVELEPAELAALALAVEVTGLSEDARGGLLKLAVAADEPQAGRVHAPPWLEIDVAAPHRIALVGAQLSRTGVRFRYQPAAGEEGERTVHPHAVVHRRGRWYLVGEDQGRGEQRAFRLDRIRGSVRTVGDPGAFPQPPAVPVDAVIPEPPPGPAEAVVAASEEVAWQIAGWAEGDGVRQPDGWTHYTVPVRSTESFVAWALEHAGEVEVIEPSDLRDQVLVLLGDLADEGR
jgi:predicted DNA-binding transcriptional regulator YafY